MEKYSKCSLNQQSVWAYQSSNVFGVTPLAPVKLPGPLSQLEKKHRVDHTTLLGVRQGCWLSYVVLVVLNYGTTPAFMANMVECRI